MRRIPRRLTLLLGFIMVVLVLVSCTTTTPTTTMPPTTTTIATTAPPSPTTGPSEPYAAGERQRSLQEAIAAANAMKSKEPVRIGVPLTYGPQNIAWIQGMAQAIENIVAMGAVPVTLRGPLGVDGERTTIEALMQRDIKAVLLGPFTSYDQSIPIVQQAQKKGIAVVGMVTSAPYQSPGCELNPWRMQTDLTEKLVTAMGGGNVLLVHTEGWIDVYDRQYQLWQAQVPWEKTIKQIGWVSEGMPTEDQWAVTRRNVTDFLTAHPGQVNGIMTFWWPAAMGAAQAVRDAKLQDKIPIVGEVLSEEILGEMSQPDSPVYMILNNPHRELIGRSAILAVKLARGETVPNVPSRITSIPVYKPEAAATLKWLKQDFADAQAFLSKYE